MLRLLSGPNLVAVLDLMPSCCCAPSHAIMLHAQAVVRVSPVGMLRVSPGPHLAVILDRMPPFWPPSKPALGMSAAGMRASPCTHPCRCGRPSAEHQRSTSYVPFSSAPQ